MLEDEWILRMAVMQYMGSRVPLNFGKKQKHVALFLFIEIDILHNACREQSGGLPLPFTSVFQVRHSCSIILSIAPIFQNTSYKFRANYLS